jgi:mRNA interferase MazF
MKRFDVYLTDLNPTIGREIKKIRPVTIVSPDELNEKSDTVIIVPMTTKERNWPTRISVKFAGKNGQIILDQIKTIDKIRLKKNLGCLDVTTSAMVLSKLREMFS